MYTLLYLLTGVVLCATIEVSPWHWKTMIKWVVLWPAAFGTIVLLIGCVILGLILTAPIALWDGIAEQGKKLLSTGLKK